MSDAPTVSGATCAHAHAAIGVERSGSRLSPKVFFVERCLDCSAELDRKKATRGYDVYSRRDDGQ
jgi:hypothetical protein